MSQETEGTKRYFYFPKNENLAPILKRNLGPMWPIAEDMLATKDYSRDVPIDGEVVEFIASRGEDIARGVIERANPRELAISGSDFVLENILDSQVEFPFYRFTAAGSPTEIWAHEKGVITPALDLGNVLGRDLPAGHSVRFDSEKKTVYMSILEHDYDVTPRLCLLGPTDSDYQTLIRQAEGRPLRFVFETRLQRIVESFLGRQKSKHGFSYEEMPVTGTTEGLVKRAEEPTTPNKADLAVDIGQTFSTARANGLKPYLEIMQTYPVVFVCYKQDSKEAPFNLADLTERFKSTYPNNPTDHLLHVRDPRDHRTPVGQT